jgi:16S rRNA (cytidine1402-2'-O)-methyltransferase
MQGVQLPVEARRPFGCRHLAHPRPCMLKASPRRRAQAKTFPRDGHAIVETSSFRRPQFKNGTLGLPAKPRPYRLSVHCLPGLDSIDRRPPEGRPAVSTDKPPHEPRGSRPRTYAVAGERIEARPLPCALYIVATPIGNLADVSLRALETLAAVDLIACEDTRVTQRLLERYQIRTATTPYHDHNAAAARPAILRRLASGQAVALVADAGTPLISDPGFKLVRAAQAAGHPVIAVPGASSVLAALCVAGLPTDRFYFAGFLPPKASARAARIAEIVSLPATIVLFEAGSRIAETLAELAERLGAREAVICRELTKLHEEVRPGLLTEQAAHYAGDVERRGEFVILIGPPKEVPLQGGEIDAMLRSALANSSTKEAVDAVAGATGESRRYVYRRAIALKNNVE